MVSSSFIYHVIYPYSVLSLLDHPLLHIPQSSPSVPPIHGIGYTRYASVAVAVYMLRLGA